MVLMEKVLTKLEKLVSLIFIFFFSFSSFLYSAVGISISTDNWYIGDLPSYAVLDSTNIVVTNTGTMWEEVWVKATNSPNWTLVQTTPTGLNKFAIRFKGGDVSEYIYIKTDYQLLQQWVAKNNKLNSDVYLRFYGPAASGTPAEQTIYVYFQARPPEGFTYNSSGNFYWKDIGPTDFPDTNWGSPPYYEILPSSLWQYMTGTTVGWLTGPPNTTSFIVPYASDYGFIWSYPPPGTNWGTVAGPTETCPFDGKTFISITVPANANPEPTFGWRLGYSGSYTTETIFFIYNTIIDSTLGTSKIYIAKLLSWDGCSANVRTALTPYTSSKSAYYVVCPLCGWFLYGSYSNVGLFSSPIPNSDSTMMNTVPYSRIVLLD